MKIAFKPTASMKQTRQRFQRRLNLQGTRGVLGDDTFTQVEDLTQPGLYFVREFQAGGTLAPAITLPMDTRANIPLKLRQGVILGYDEHNEYCIQKADRSALLQAGVNPGALNPSNPQLQFVSQQRIITALSTPNNPIGLTVLMNAWIFVKHGIVRTFQGAVIDLSGDVPSAGQQCIACLFVLADGSGTEVQVSTPKSLLSTLDPAVDVQECFDAATAGSHPIWAWRLYGGQTVITAEDAYLDLRGFINVDSFDASPYYQTIQNNGSDVALRHKLNFKSGSNIALSFNDDSGGDRTEITIADLQSDLLITTNAAQQVLLAIPVAQATGLSLHIILTAARDDFSAGLGADGTVTAYRATGGNVTSPSPVGNLDTWGITSTLDVAFGLDTGTQTVTVLVTGIAGQNWRWRCRYAITLV